ncbi:Hypothetical predicted protein, partial [Paramuricea clavata]
MGKQKGGNFKGKKYQRSKQDGGFLLPILLGNVLRPQRQRRAPARHYPPPQYYTQTPIRRKRKRKTQQGGIVKGEWGPHNLGGLVQITPKMIQRRQK